MTFHEQSRKLVARVAALSLLCTGLCISTFFYGSSADAQMAPPDNYNDRYEQWCDGTERILEQARQDANVAQSRGNNEGAKNALLAGLYRAMDSGRRPRPAGILTVRAINRSLELGKALVQATAHEPNGTRTVVYTLFSLYDFISEVTRDLDRPYTIPYLRCGRCQDYNRDREYETRYVAFASRQIRTILETLSNDDRWGRAYPVGSVSAYLTALRLTTSYAAADLRESLWSYEYACSILDLDGLSSRIARYLNGESTYYDDVDAVSTTRRAAYEVISQLTPETSCRRR